MQTITKRFTGAELLDGLSRLQRLSAHALPVHVTDAVITTQDRVLKALRAYERLLQAVLDQHKYRDEDGAEIPIIAYQGAKGRVVTESPVEPPIHRNPDYRGWYRQGRRYKAGQIVLHEHLVYQALASGKLSEPSEDSADWLQLVKALGEERVPYVASGENVPIRGALEYRRKESEVKARLWEVRIRTFALSDLAAPGEDGEETRTIPPDCLWLPMLEDAGEEEADEYDVEAMLAELAPEGGDGLPPSGDVEVTPHG